MALSDQQQAYLMLLVFVLPSLIAWLANGAPTDHTSISILAAAVLSGILAYVKEALGTSPPVQRATIQPK